MPSALVRRVNEKHTKTTGFTHELMIGKDGRTTTAPSGVLVLVHLP